jgi:hypothetical protein
MVMRFATVRAILVVMLWFGSGASFSGERCHGVSMSEVRSLGKLPSDLRKQLPRSEAGLDGIADRDGRFNATDVVTPNVPTRRFTLAAVGATCAVIAVERGGIARWFEVTEYRLSGATWNLVVKATIRQEPRSIADLLAN